MCTAIALPVSELPDEMLPDLAERVHTRGDGKEVRFHWQARPPLLPVWWGGKLRLLRWGCRDRDERKLPPTGWTWKATVEEGKWAALEPEPVEVPAAYAYTKGVWFKVKEGVRGLVVHTRAGEPAVFLLCEPSTRYYKIMTKSEWTPCLIGELI